MALFHHNQHQVDQQVRMSSSEPDWPVASNGKNYAELYKVNRGIGTRTSPFSTRIGSYRCPLTRNYIFVPTTGHKSFRVQLAI
jgi:hypothetical protein